MLAEWELLACEDQLADMVNAALQGILPREAVSVLDFVADEIDLARDSTAARDRLVLDPYQREPLEAIATDGVNEVSVVAVEQTGKSAIWVCYVLYRLRHGACPMCVVYPNDDVAADTNRERLEPLMQGIPELARELARPKTKRKDAYHFREAVMHFMGAGSPVLSRPFELVVADEPDFWVGLTNDDAASKQSQKAQKNVGNLLNLRKRLRTYRERRKFLKVCSPTLISGTIWKEWKAGSRGMWHLQCLKCGQLVPSHRTGCLQWALDDSEEPVEASIRWVCPECGREHRESEAKALNDGGRYIHKRDTIRTNRTFQWGALSCPRAIGWLEIALAQMAGGDSGTLEDQKFLDNSFRGLPLQERKRKSVKQSDFLSTHERPQARPEDLRAIILSADTQDDGWFAVVRGIDDQGHSHGLRAEFCQTADDLEALYNWQYGDLVPMIGIIDEGGHRVKAVRSLIKRNGGLYTYKGASMSTKDIDDGWVVSDNVDRLILANPYRYQEKLLWLLYKCSDPDGAEFWSVPAGMEGFHPDYVSQLLALRSNPRKRNGHEYRNWDSGSDADHFFDAEKMWLVALSYALAKVGLKCWRGGRLPIFHQKYLRRELEKQKRGR